MSTDNHMSNAEIVAENQSWLGWFKPAIELLPKDVQETLLPLPPEEQEKLKKKKANEERIKTYLLTELSWQREDMATMGKLKELLEQDPVQRDLLGEMAAESGLVSLRVRRKLWPKLLGLNPHAMDPQEYEVRLGLAHKERGTIDQDVARTSWLNTKIGLIPSTSRPQIQDHLQGNLRDLLNAVVNRRRDRHGISDTHYVQGVHEIGAVVLLIFGRDRSFHVLDQILTHHLKDASGQENMNLVMQSLEILSRLLETEDPELYQLLMDIHEEDPQWQAPAGCGAEQDKRRVVQTMLLPWTLTWFAGYFLPGESSEQHPSFTGGTGPSARQLRQQQRQQAGVSVPINSSEHHHEGEDTPESRKEARRRRKHEKKMRMIDPQLSALEREKEQLGNQLDLMALEVNDERPGEQRTRGSTPSTHPTPGGLLEAFGFPVRDKTGSNSTSTSSTKQSLDDRLSNIARLFDLFIASNPLMPIYVSVAILCQHRDIILQKRGTLPADLLRKWIVHVVPTLLDRVSTRDLVKRARDLYSARLPSEVMRDMKCPMHGESVLDEKPVEDLNPRSHRDNDQDLPLLQTAPRRHTPEEFIHLPTCPASQDGPSSAWCNCGERVGDRSRRFCSCYSLPPQSVYHAFPFSWNAKPLRIDRVLKKIANTSHFYEGEMNAKNEMHGWGRYIYSSGDLYEGQLRHSIREGLGRFVWEGTGEKYEGQWSQDKRHGYGRHIWRDGTKYLGAFKENEISGYGVYYWPDGKRYEGKFYKGLQHGTGIFSLVDGEPIDGQWQEGKLVKSSEVSLVVRTSEDCETPAFRPLNLREEGVDNYPDTPKTTRRKNGSRSQASALAAQERAKAQVSELLKLLIVNQVKMRNTGIDKAKKSSKLGKLVKFMSK